jgi:hypothetical protein
MHDSQNYTVNEIAPWIIEQSGMKEKGYRFVTVAECLGDKSGMYRSGNTYGDIDINQNATIENETDRNVTIENVQQKLESGAIMTYKPMSILLALCFGLVASLLL